MTIPPATIPPATADDLDALVELASAARADQAVHQLVFWRPAPTRATGTDPSWPDRSPTTA